MTILRIDCNTCLMRNIACNECVMSVILGDEPVTFDDAERSALDVLTESGLVPKLVFDNKLRIG